MWFKALLHQDPAFFDVYDIGGVAAQVGANANTFRHSMGRKLGEGIQFFTTGIGGLAFAFWRNWRVAFVVLAIVPLVALVSVTVIQLNQTKGSRSAKAYKQAGGIAHSAVSAIKTLLSLNAVNDIVAQYKEATTSAYKTSVSALIKQGFANGCMMGSFFLFYFILTLYGTSLLYKDVQSNGCDPSGAIETNITCSNSGPAVFGAMLGIAFAAQGISQVGTFLENFSLARVATYEALLAIRRKPGAPEEVIYEKNDEKDMTSTTHSRRSKSEPSDLLESGEQPLVVKAILPKFEIDSASTTAGLKPDIQGAISIRDVFFAYPTRPTDAVLNGLSVEIEAGKTVAFVGPSGGGKSTIVAMLERFYDPVSGSILVDGVNMRDFNVVHLRRSIGYVGQVTFSRLCRTVVGFVPHMSLPLTSFFHNRSQLSLLHRFEVISSTATQTQPRNRL
jgi:ATP-binding cassette subfamily B (MDR/TAP) protein 1